jgi:ABC-2 type transport system permease protein
MQSHPSIHRTIVWLNESAAFEFLAETHAIAAVELHKLLRQPSEVLARAVQPVIWIVMFGEVFSRVRGLATTDLNYHQFMTPGVLAQSVLFSAIFYGIAVIWERDLGITHKLLVSPAYRLALVLGKSLAAGFRGMIQAFIIYLVAAIMRIELLLNPLAILGVLAVVTLGSAVFATFSFVIACLVKSHERFMGIGQLMTMPLFFASNAIYPLELMPPWLRALAQVNPLTYLVDALRIFMLGRSHGTFGTILDVAVLLLVFGGLLTLAVRIYPRLIQ